MKSATFGSISRGTMREEDLIPDFVYELERLAEGDEFAELIKEANAWRDEEEHEDDESGADILEELFDALNEAAPPYGYFGAHEGDGSDYGFWLSSDFPADFDGIRVDDTSEIPADYVGEVLHVNDHGNVTLYAKGEGADDLKEIWAVV